MKGLNLSAQIYWNERFQQLSFVRVSAKPIFEQALKSDHIDYLSKAGFMLFAPTISDCQGVPPTFHQNNAVLIKTF